MRPCDCLDQHTVRTELNEQGIGFNSNISIEVSPASVIITSGPCTLKIPQHRFKAFAEWYLEDQGPVTK